MGEWILIAAFVLLGEDVEVKELRFKSKEACGVAVSKITNMPRELSKNMKQHGFIGYYGLQITATCFKDEKE